MMMIQVQSRARINGRFPPMHLERRWAETHGQCDRQHPAAPWWWCCWWVRAEQRTRRRRWRRQQLCRATRPEHAAQLTTFQPVRSLNWALLFCCVHSNLTSQETRSAACKRWLLLLVVVDGLPQRLPSCRQPRRYSARGSDYFPHGFLSGGAPTDRTTARLTTPGRTGIEGTTTR